MRGRIQRGTFTVKAIADGSDVVDSVDDDPKDGFSYASGPYTVRANQAEVGLHQRAEAICVERWGKHPGDYSGEQYAIAYAAAEDEAENAVAA